MTYNSIPEEQLDREDNVIDIHVPEGTFTSVTITDVGFHIDDAIRKSAEEGRLYPHLVVGVDVYSSEVAADGATLDRDRQCPFNDNMYLIDRHFQIKRLKGEDFYDPKSDIAEVIGTLRKEGARGAAFLEKSVLEIDDLESAYVLTPLTEEENAELMRG